MRRSHRPRRSVPAHRPIWSNSASISWTSRSTPASALHSGRGRWRSGGAGRCARQGEGRPLRVPYGTKAEGGNKAIANPDYVALYETLLKARFADLIDV